MSITSIELENFKCFEVLTLPTRPLTILTGYNAAGKSSLLQSVLLFSQQLRSNNDDGYFSLNGKMANLGNAGDVFCKHSKSKTRSLNIAFESESERAAIQLSSQDAPRGKLIFENLKLECDGEVITVIQNLNETSKENASPLIKSIKECVFVGLIRQSQSQTFPMPHDSSDKIWDVGRDGQYAPYILDIRSTDIVDPERRHPDETSETVQGQCDAWLNELFPKARVNSTVIRSTDLLKLEFQNSKSSGWVRPDNIGYGLSYAFPLIVALMTAPKGGIIIIDSPEAHLHPRAQSKIGQMISKIAASGVQIFVETHSDHFLNGIRIATKDEKIPAHDVQIYFFGTDTDATGIESINIDKQGNMSHWPEGFFDQSEHDLFKLAGC